MQAARTWIEIAPFDGSGSKRQPVQGTQLTIGRSGSASVVIDHSTVSRLHAELALDTYGNWWLHDLGSTNGTFVNGNQVQERMLKPGDRMGIGDFELRLQTRRSRLASTTMRAEAISDDTALAMLSAPAEPPRITASHLRTIMALGRQLATVQDPSTRLETLCRFMVGESFPAESAVVVRMQQGAAAARLVLGPFQRELETETGRHFSRSVLNKLWETREPVLATNLPFDSNHGSEVGPLTISANVRTLAVVACPLYIDSDKLDALYLEFPPSYATMEWLTVVTLAADAHQQAELAWEVRHHERAAAAVERELETARQIQLGLVPRFLSFQGMDASIGFRPCRWVGGDYVDALPLPDGRVLMAIADVCGKGLQAALVASSLHTMVHATVGTAPSVERLVENINTYLCTYLPDHSFVTMLCLTIDPRTGELECVNAGHPPAFVLGPDGSLRQLQSEQNTPLGMIKTPLKAQHAKLEADELLVAYTDGLTELLDENRDPLGEERLGLGLSSIVRAHPTASVHTTRHQLSEMLDAYRGSQLVVDDWAFLIARRVPVVDSKTPVAPGRRTVATS